MGKFLNPSNPGGPLFKGKGSPLYPLQSEGRKHLSSPGGPLYKGKGSPLYPLHGGGGGGGGGTDPRVMEMYAELARQNPNAQPMQRDPQTGQMIPLNMMGSYSGPSPSPTANMPRPLNAVGQHNSYGLPQTGGSGMNVGMPIPSQDGGKYGVMTATQQPNSGGLQAADPTQAAAMAMLSAGAGRITRPNPQMGPRGITGITQGYQPVRQPGYDQ